MDNGPTRNEAVSSSSKAGNVPYEERPWSGGNVCFLRIVVDRGGPSNGVNIRAQEEEIHNDVDDFEEDTVFPAVRHGARGEESPMAMVSAICRPAISDVQCDRRPGPLQ